jgi:hypothetical protein
LVILESLGQRITGHRRAEKEPLTSLKAHRR